MAGANPQAFGARFDTLANITPRNVESYLLLHTMQPKLLFQVLVHLGASGVDRIRSIVGLL
jgi:hypothetical protein